MEVLILAAGRGERMRPLTDHTPKPLVEAGGTTLIERQIERLVAAGHTRLVVNLAHLGGQIRARLDDGGRYGASIRYSPEPERALDTGGGILQAMTHIDGDVFAVVNADIWTDFPYHTLPLRPARPAWLVLVDNPEHHPRGDFSLVEGRVRKVAPGANGLTFSGIAVYQRRLFDGLSPGRFPLLPVLDRAIDNDRVGGMHYKGPWVDVGTPDRLESLRAAVAGG